MEIRARKEARGLAAPSARQMLYASRSHRTRTSLRKPYHGGDAVIPAPPALLPCAARAHPPGIGAPSSGASAAPTPPRYPPPASMTHEKKKIKIKKIQGNSPCSPIENGQYICTESNVTHARKWMSCLPCAKLFEARAAVRVRGQNVQEPRHGLVRAYPALPSCRSRCLPVRPGCLMRILPCI